MPALCGPGCLPLQHMTVVDGCHCVSSVGRPALRSGAARAHVAGLRTHAYAVPGGGDLIRGHLAPAEMLTLLTLCSTGWLTFWGDKMANTSLLDFVGALENVLDYANGTGSVNFYMGKCTLPCHMPRHVRHRVLAGSVPAAAWMANS